MFKIFQKSQINLPGATSDPPNEITIDSLFPYYLVSLAYFAQKLKSYSITNHFSPSFAKARIRRIKNLDQSIE